MDYDKFKGDIISFEQWHKESMFENKESIFENDDRVNSPSHYTTGKVEAIEVIEDAINEAPSMQTGMLHAQVLKYMLRLWLKDNPLEDAKKAQWYLTRLISKLDS